MTSWKEMGYAAGLAVMTGSKITTNYPTLDNNSEQDEQDYIQGYNQAIVEFNSAGTQVLYHYSEEDHDNG